ncbi:peptide ABC transporter substrate-binding protein [Microlunatus flavus]|uniref:Oligopeptide transport system substrate-binding protein n=1 Tax=Microlunatus flavus TaxID=1036181 RepID=A0A1H9KZL7_9ACTN|nr:ABC transporter substrate-binding protein [Microlunatus flavus]SER04691.1 oligopeptide transport system substrate-binding protein [Microlunatus flavus]
MHTSRLTAGVTALVALALLATGCSSGDEPPGGTEGGAGGAGGTLRISNAITTDPIIPMTVDTATTRVMDMVWTGLVRYDDKLAPYNANAESIKTTDATTFTITLKKDYTFSDGTPVDADSYVDAWNYSAYGPNAAQSASYFSLIKGYDAVNPAAADGSSTPPAPTAKTLSGLKKLGDLEFSVTLTKPMASFPSILGYSIFYPMPKAFFDDPKTYEKLPVGNGPYTMKSLVPGQEVDLVKTPGYNHEDAGKADGINFISFSEDTAAYTAVQGDQLDYAPVPTAYLATFQKDFPDTSALVTGTSMMDMQVPLYQQKYADPNVRIALSMAIDRESIVKALLPGAATPADGWVSPALPGYQKGACGENCSYNPEKAKELWAKASFSGDVVITTLAPQATLFTSVCQSITDTLGVACKVSNVADRTTYKGIAQAFEAPGPIRWGWAIDYPTMENMLVPRFTAGGSSNWMKYASPQFQALIDKANAATDPAQAATQFNAAQAVLGKDMPDVPIYFQQGAAVWSEGTEGMALTGFGWPDLLKAHKTA